MPPPLESSEAKDHQHDRRAAGDDKILCHNSLMHPAKRLCIPGQGKKQPERPRDPPPDLRIKRCPRPFANADRQHVSRNGCFGLIIHWFSHLRFPALLANRPPRRSVEAYCGIPPLPIVCARGAEDLVRFSAFLCSVPIKHAGSSRAKLKSAGPDVLTGRRPRSVTIDTR